MQHVLRMALLFVALILAGCGDATLRDSLTQDQANEIVAELVERGIPSSVERETGGRGKYRVSVKRGRYSEAVSVLYELKLPSEPRIPFAELIAPRGLMPDSREIEALRLDRALAAEIEETLQNNPSIAAARVVVRLNSVNLGNTANDVPKGAAAIIRMRQGATVSEEALRAMLGQALPGIDQAHIKIEIHSAQASDSQPQTSVGVERSVSGEVRKVPLTAFLWLWRVPEDEYNSLAGLLTLGILGVFILGVSLGTLYMSARHNARATDLPGAQRRLPAGKADRVRRELPEPPKDTAGGM